METALLVGNGFTAQIIKEYSNTYMIDQLCKQEKQIFSYADQLFSTFRGDSKMLTSTSSFNSNLTRKIIEKLDRLHFRNSSDVFETYFIKYGLIYECNNAKISSVESLLKVISLFQLVDLFLDEDKCKIKHTANQTSVYKGYKQDKIEMRGDRAEMSDFPLYLNTVAGGLDRRDQTIGGFSFVVKIYAHRLAEQRC